jgi:hypothetical protein
MKPWVRTATAARLCFWPNAAALSFARPDEIEDSNKVPVSPVSFSLHHAHVAAAFKS